MIVLIKFRRDNSGDNLCNNLPYVGSCQIGYLFAISGLVVILITAGEESSAITLSTALYVPL